jgi:hypothetical protein
MDKTIGLLSYGYAQTRAAVFNTITTKNLGLREKILVAVRPVFSKVEKSEQEVSG